MRELLLICFLAFSSGCVRPTVRTITATVEKDLEGRVIKHVVVEQIVQEWPENGPIQLKHIEVHRGWDGGQLRPVRGRVEPPGGSLNGTVVD